MTIDWAALGSVLLVSLGTVAVVTGAFAVGVTGLSRFADAKDAGTSDRTGLITAVLCFAVCAVVVLYGIYLIVA